MDIKSIGCMREVTTKGKSEREKKKMHKGIHFFLCIFYFLKKQTYLEISLLLVRCLYPLQKCCSWLVLITLLFEADLFWEKNICGLIIWLCVYMFVYIHVSFWYIPCNNLGKWRLKAFCYVHIPKANWSARIIIRKTLNDMTLILNLVLKF